MYPSQAMYVSCEDCGLTLLRGEFERHVCDEGRRVAFQIARLRPELDRFDDEFGAWLGSPAGQFATFYAERTH